MGKVRVFMVKQLVSVQQSEAEDDQHTQVCGIEIENISSTSVFILWGSAGAGSCSNQELGTGGPEECSQAKYLKWRTSSTPGTTFVYSVVKLQCIANI